ncbi:magnesium-translocating P-type ATPase [Bradyrhizobium guangdongense]|uniref:Magnesium-transporting ATPase, P-type 1 n=1 Tax=Bradyrhizobium guangdongense TaxID=1325090 RepID=A0A410V1U6_9BRAD|nr:magnesium-translocating P-type ATPase [Bradyrhizobium guangdongense]QAU37608.1 magnesium-translocating P-type ATPase [Bradyrhizobium guangdongense]QOZ58664.1 magnesium-translocating P-type ATPase [Bradyrhizobium guangdongense]GGI19965.1 magnesium-translocating P-type ATPase [Bradyrhizobium guangdongense]
MLENPSRPDTHFWRLSPLDLSARLGCGLTGLTSAEAAGRLDRFGRNSDAPPRIEGAARAILRRLLEPLSLILLVAGIISMLTGDEIGGLIIVLILALSIGLDTVQEGHAVRAAEILRRSVALKAEVKRDGGFREVEVDQVVPGDILRVRAGDIIPADALILEATAFTAGEAALTGEPYPVQKQAGTASGPDDTSNALFRGAVAQTGEAIALVVRTGRDTVFGAAASALAETQAPSPFERDLREFGLVIARATLALVLVVLTIRVVFGRPVLDSLLFAVALAVGLTPELLPMITTVTLSRGALRMAGRKVIVKRLAAIHDLGAMTVLCTDKTGTLTSAEITLARSLDAAGKDEVRAAQLGAIAASLGGDRGALDAALVAGRPDAAQGWTLAGRQAFDFSRRLGSVLATGPEGELLIVKGAPEAVLALCALDEQARQAAMARVHELATAGLRAVAVASRPWNGALRNVETEDETDLVFEGFCAFADPPKPTAAAAIARLAASGISLKILSGDDPVVVKRLAGLVGLNAERVLSGAEIAELSDEALIVQVRSTDAFGRLAPDQKSRIVKALQAGKDVVGFLGDGINDAPALKVADVGLSVDGATGVAQAAANMILLASDLEVVADGVEEGRRTFANILKYVRMGASSNFGNMLSMAAASIALPFLPMLPTQILLNNLLYDLSELGIPFDRVSAEATAQPQVWSMSRLVRFAAIMGPLSSLFDFLTFGALLYLFQASPDEFRTAWFVESMATQILVIFVIRTNGRPWRNWPDPALAASSLVALLVAMVLPFTPLGAWFGFVAPPPIMTAGIAVLVVVYLGCAELLKPFAIRAGRRS